MGCSPTALSLRLLRRPGYTADVCERYLHQVQRKRDLFGFADVIACHPTCREILLVQCTTLGHAGDRLKRVLGRPELRAWVAAGGAAQVHGWVKRGGRWDVKVVAIGPEALEGVGLTAPPRRRGGWSEQPSLFPEGG
jgi:hypothetical protein